MAAGAGGGAEPSADGRGGSSAAEGPRLSARLPGVSRGPLPECGPGVAGWCSCVAAPWLPAQTSDTARSGRRPHGWSPRVEDSAITAAVDGARCLAGSVPLHGPRVRFPASQGLQCRAPLPARLPQRFLSPELLANYTEPLCKVALARVGAPSLLFPDYFLL